jgi:hypothetical protein
VYAVSLQVKSMRLDVLTTTTVLIATSLIPPLNAQPIEHCSSALQRPSQCSDSDSYRFPLIDRDVVPVVFPLNQPQRRPDGQRLNQVRLAYPAAWVGVTQVELTSESDEWVTVTIEGIEHDVELSFTHNQATQAIYLEPGVYRFRFRPTLSNRPWQSGYISVGRTNLLRVSFDQESEHVVVFDDPDSWSPDGTVGYR